MVDNKKLEDSVTTKEIRRLVLNILNFTFTIEVIKLTRILLQITSHEETSRNIQEKILAVITTFCQKVESLDSEVQLLKKASNSQQHDSKYAELRCLTDIKRPKLKGDVEKHLKTQVLTNYQLQVQMKQVQVKEKNQFKQSI